MYVLTQQLQFDDAKAISLFAGTSALAYLSPLLGAIVADSLHFQGRYRVIWNFGCMYVFGLILMTMAAYQTQRNEIDENGSGGGENLLFERILTFLGLLFVCAGTGGIKPCVSAFGADQVTLNDNSKVTTKDTNDNNRQLQKEDERVREFFNSFYFCINVGALTSFAVIPLLRSDFGFGAAFLFPTMGMVLALGVFRSNKHTYKHRKRSVSDPTLLDILKLCFQIVFNGKQGQHLSSSSSCCVFCQKIKRGTASFVVAHSDSPRHVPIAKEEEEAVDDDHDLFRDEWQPSMSLSDDDDETMMRRKQQQRMFVDAAQALHVLPIMLFFPIFWMLYDQQGSVWTLQATRLNLHDLFEPEQLQILNPLEIMILIPLFDKLIYPTLEIKYGYNLKPTRRMEYGMFLAAVSFFASAWLEYCIQQKPDTQIVSVMCQIPQITILTVAEILLNVTGLEFAYSQAPTSMQALILALYLFMTTIGDMLGAALYASIFASMDVVLSMIVCAICMLINLAMFTHVVGK